MFLKNLFSLRQSTWLFLKIHEIVLNVDLVSPNVLKASSVEITLRQKHLDGMGFRKYWWLEGTKLGGSWSSSVSLRQAFPSDQHDREYFLPVTDGLALLFII